MGSQAKPTRFIFIAGIFLAVLALLPTAISPEIRGSLFMFLKGPLSISNDAASWLGDLFYFRRNAQENRTYRQSIARDRLESLQSKEIRVENERLTQLLELKPSLAHGADHVFFARVIARSPLAWNRTFWVDKGYEDGMRENLPVFSQEALAGKIIEVREGASKAILLTDPNCKIGVLIERTKQQGILFGTLSGECRMKYISMGADIKAGDRVQTAGLGLYFPKGIPVGVVTGVWKEPGQIYQTAQVKLLTDLGKLEEVAIPDVR